MRTCKTALAYIHFCCNVEPIWMHSQIGLVRIEKFSLVSVLLGSSTPSRVT